MPIEDRRAFAGNGSRPPNRKTGRPDEDRTDPLVRRASPAEPGRVAALSQVRTDAGTQNRVAIHEPTMVGSARPIVAGYGPPIWS